MKRQLLIYSLLITLDQGLKWWVGTNWPDRMVINQGLVFGLGGIGFYSWVILFFIWLATIYYWSRVSWDRPRQWGIGLIASGGLSNLIDRPLAGGVRDYIYYPYFNLYANLADLAVTAGVLTIIFIEIKRYRAGR